MNPSRDLCNRAGLDDGGFAIFYSHWPFEAGNPIVWLGSFYDAEGGLIATHTLAAGGHFAVGQPNPQFAALSDGRVAVLSNTHVSSSVGQDIQLKILDADGYIEGTRVTRVGGPGPDGLDVGDDGSIYVSLYAGEVYRFVPEIGTDAPGADDRYRGSGSDETALGETADEVFAMRKGNDVVFAGGGNDKVLGGSGHDSLEGQGGHDTVVGDRGKDVLLGQAGKDLLNGGKGDDTIFGGAGQDNLRAGKGDDLMFGGAGDDLMLGGLGNDQFVFSAGRDTIGDFSDDGDVLHLASDLWDDTLSNRSLVRNYATNTDDGVLFDFGPDNSLLVQGVDRRADLVDDIVQV